MTDDIGPRVRRAFRLRRYDDAAAAVRGLAWSEQLEIKLAIAADEAGCSSARAQALVGWLAHIVRGRDTMAPPEDRHWMVIHKDDLAELPKDAEVRQLWPDSDEPDAVNCSFLHAAIPGYEHEYRPGKLSEAVDYAERALLEDGGRLFVWNGAIVRLDWTADERLVPSPIDETALTEIVGRVVAWKKHSGFKPGTIPRLNPVACPPIVARTYISRGPGLWRLPVLRGIIEAPTLRADGSVIYHPGYDERTGLYLISNSERFLDFDGDAFNAAEVLRELLIEFPFVTPDDRAVVIAAILTGCVRRCLPTAPMVAFTAPTAGTGKSLLVDVINVIVTGRTAPGFTWPNDPHEQRKALDAALLAGTSTICIDNVAAPVGGDRLCQLLTQQTASVRVLGESRIVEAPCQALVMCNGNNLSIMADATRRTILCRLDAQVERPETRTFNRPDLLEHVTANRGLYLGAALKILTEYHKRGRPVRPAAFGSFGDWNAWVRGAVIWATGADPVATQEHVRENDPVRSDMAAVLHQWRHAIGGRRVSGSELIAAAIQVPEWREALLGVAGVAGSVNTRRLGAWLRDTKGKRIDGLHVAPAGTLRGTLMWALHDDNAEPANNVVDMPAACSRSTGSDDLAGLVS